MGRSAVPYRKMRKGRNKECIFKSATTHISRQNNYEALTSLKLPLEFPKGMAAVDSKQHYHETAFGLLVSMPSRP